VNIRVEGLDFVYNPGTPLEVAALRSIDFEIPSGKVLGILGGTGSGKTTLIKHLNGLLEPTRGRILFDGVASAAFGSSLARKVGVVFQRPERQLFEPTVFEDISFVLRRFSDMDDGEIRERVRAASEMVGLDIELLGDRPAASLSDGLRRKVAIAGILVNRPDVLVLDEPAVGLDPAALSHVVRLVREYAAVGKTVVVVSHDMDAFLPLLDFLLVLFRGMQAAFGDPSRVCSVLADHEGLRGLLPGLALFVEDLRTNGYDVPENEFGIPELVHRLLTVREQGAAS
jgi:energy-coupling factor transport system ATP-binding protein